jgi:hypothetical protein
MPNSPRRSAWSVRRADETQGWLEFIDAAGLTPSKDLPRLMLEATELVRIMSSAHGTARYTERDRIRNRSQRS